MEGARINIGLGIFGASGPCFLPAYSDFVVWANHCLGLDEPDETILKMMEIRYLVPKDR